MSRLVTARYEYAQFDDAQGILSPAKDVPPTYPPALDEYRYSSTASVAQSFGVQTVNSTTGNGVTINAPALSTLTLFCPVTNTSLVGLAVNNATPTLGGATTNLILYCAPGQTITLPSSINAGNLNVGAYTTGLVPTAAAYMANVMWSL